MNLKIEHRQQLGILQNGVNCAFRLKDVKKSRPNTLQFLQIRPNITARFCRVYKYDYRGYPLYI